MLTAERESDLEMKAIADRLWNPMVAMFANAALKPASPTIVKKPVEEKPLGKRTPKALGPPIAPGLDVNQVHQRLRACLQTRPHLYQTPAHSHIRCDQRNCSFCLKVFRTINLTKCVGHKACSNTGFYPHVGPALWSMLKRDHHNGTNPRLRVRPPREHELPCLSEEPSTGSETMDTVHTPSPSTDSPQRKRTYSSASEEENDQEDDQSLPSWAVSVESQWRRQRASSCPPGSVHANPSTE